jgi:hypothetical protein
LLLGAFFLYTLLLPHSLFQALAQASRLAGFVLVGFQFGLYLFMIDQKLLGHHRLADVQDIAETQVKRQAGCRKDC